VALEPIWVRIGRPLGEQYAYTGVGFPNTTGRGHSRDR